MKAWNKAIVLLLLLGVFCSTAMAAEKVDQHPYLSFSGTTANCSVTIQARGKCIDATLELWQGSTLVDSWHNTGNNKVYISGSHSNCTPDVTYTLTVTGTIGGVAITCTPVSADGQIDFPLKDASGVKAFGILHDEFLADDLVLEGWGKDFHDCYGGAYLDDKGNLTVYYQKDAVEAAALTKEYVDGQVQDDIPFIPVDYSYRDLLDLQYKVLAMKESALKNGGSTLLEKIQSVGICQKDNCLRLMTDALSDQEVNALTELLESIPFRIETMDGAVYCSET